MGSRSVDDARGSKPEEWSKVIQWLLHASAGPPGEGRQRATTRLAVLWEREWLLGSEVDQFAAAVWAARDTRTGLPISIGLLPVALLRLPEPEKGISIALVKSFCLGSDFVPLCTSSTGPNGKIIKNFTFGTDPGTFLDTIVQVTRSARRDLKHRGMRNVRWGRQDLFTIFDKIISWWEAEGKELNSIVKSDMIDQQIKERFGRILRVIWSVLLPCCRVGDKLSSRIREIVFEFDAAGLPMTTAFPPLLRHFPHLLDDVIQRIRRGLFSRDEERAHLAIGALFIWVTEQVPCRHTGPPSELLRDFSFLSVAASYRDSMQPSLTPPGWWNSCQASSLIT